MIIYNEPTEYRNVQYILYRTTVVIHEFQGTVQQQLLKFIGTQRTTTLIIYPIC